MYVDISEQARLIYALGNTRENELLGMWRSVPVFKSLDTVLDWDVERFLALNGKFNLRPRAPLDDSTSIEQWAELETKILWTYFFRNKRKVSFEPQLYTRTDSIVPNDIYDKIYKGTATGLRELLLQAAPARTRFSESLNL